MSTSTIDHLHDLLRTLRSQRRRRLILEGVAYVMIAALAAMLAGMLVTKVMGTTGSGVLVARLLGYGLVLAAAVRWLFLPLARRATDSEFALYVEERAPGLRQALISAVNELEQPEGRQSSPALTARVVERVVKDLRPITDDGRIERPRTVRAGRVLAGAVVAGALMLALGPGGLREAARVLFAPWSIAIAATPPAASVGVEPGDADVPRGGSLDVRATLMNFSADGAELVFRSDSTAEWVRIPMGRDSAAEAFSGRLFDIIAPTQYYIEANGVRSETFDLRVTDLPAVQKVAIELRYPAYTGLTPEREEDGGDVAAVMGTTVIVEPSVTRPVRAGTLTFDDGTTVPLTLDSAGTLRGTFRVRRNGFYRVDLVAADGRAVSGGVQYSVEALQDRPPEVRITTPGRDSKATALEEVTIESAASDDYGVRSLELRYRVNGGEEKQIPLATGSKDELQAAHTLMLEEFGLKPGDLVAYNAAATDASGQEALSDVYFLEIRPWSRNYRQADEGGGGGGGGGGGESPTDFVRQQREIVSGTYNWLRDSASRSEKARGEDATVLAIAQGRLREEVDRLSQQLVQRGLANTDTSFAQIQKELAAAAKEMKTAEEQLGQRKGREALPPEERALAHVQRADALYRDVQVQQGQQGGGGGGGGGGSQAEDLADLFELETDRMRNQYEAVQQEGSAGNSQAQEVDETLERLRQLASRQQQENERMQRQAEAMRQRMGREASGGGGGAQRELARQAEEEARRLERLSREQQSQELASAAQQMQRAADAMRQAATGSEAQGNAALEQLRRATQRLEESQTKGLAEDVKGLAERAREAGEVQRGIAEDVAKVQGTSGAQRAQQLAELSQRKDALSNEVRDIESEANRLSREGRRDQPGAASRLGEASDAIRESRVQDRIQYSKSVMRGGSPEYARAFEGQIGENIAEAAEKLGEAVGALQGESAARREERALEQARELVRGVESLRDRMQQGQEGQQGEGQQGQQGQQSQQGQGQQGQQGQGQQGQQGQGQQGQQGQGQQGQQGQGQQGQQGQGQQGQGQGQGQEGQGQQGGQGGQGARDGRAGGTGGMNNGSQLGGGGNNADPRQYAREFGLRRQNAEQLRELAREQGVDVADLDRAIQDLRRLESGRPLGDPLGAARLQEQLLERLKSFEFAMYRQLTQNGTQKAALGARSPVPSEYRAQVEEYYRSLARPGTTPPARTP